MNEVITNRNKPLIIVFVVLVILFLAFAGGALSVTISDGGMMGFGIESGISWMWIPALLFLTLSLILGWVIYGKRDNR